MLAGCRRKDIQSLCLWAPAGNIREIVLGKKRKGYWDAGGLMLGVNFLKDIKNINVFKKAVRYDKNILLIHGDNDETIEHHVSEKYLDIYGDRAVLHTVEGADHTFNSINWENEVLNYTMNFFKKELE